MYSSVYHVQDRSVRSLDAKRYAPMCVCLFAIQHTFA